jgi:hypothetical protein
LCFVEFWDCYMLHLRPDLALPVAPQHSVATNVFSLL